MIARGDTVMVSLFVWLRITIFVKKITMALTTVSFTINLDYSADPKVFKLTDTTDFAGQSVALADANGIFKITGPAGVIHNNTSYVSPDIDADVSLEFNTVQLPLDSDGNVLQGAYEIVYSVKDDNTGDIATTTTTFTLDYTAPTVDVDITFDYAIPKLTSTDSTDYDVNGVTPTIVRTHLIIYPGNLAADVSGAAATVSTNTVYTKKDTPLQYSGKVTSTLTYSFTNFTLTDSVTGTEYYSILLDPNLCDVYCGMRQVYQNLIDVKGTSAEPGALSILAKVTSIAQLIDQAIACGKTEHVADYLDQMRECGGFTSDCGCDEDDDPVLITGLGGSEITVVVDAGSGISVSSASGGGTTTYTVSIDAATLATINAMENNKPVAGTGITVSSAVVSGITEYTINTTVVEPEIMALQVTLTPSPGGSPTIVNTKSKIYGTDSAEVLQAPGYRALAATWATGVTDIRVESFFTGGTVDYFPTAQIVELTGNGFKVYGAPVDVKITDYDTATFNITFMSPDGLPLNGSSIDEYSEIKLIIKIMA